MLNTRDIIKGVNIKKGQTYNTHGTITFYSYMYSRRLCIYYYNMYGSQQRVHHILEITPKLLIYKDYILELLNIYWNKRGV
jgi:hypothetical protein